MDVTLNLIRKRFLLGCRVRVVALAFLVRKEPRFSFRAR